MHSRATVLVVCHFSCTGNINICCRLIACKYLLVEHSVLFERQTWPIQHVALSVLWSFSLMSLSVILPCRSDALNMIVYYNVLIGTYSPRIALFAEGLLNNSLFFLYGDDRKIPLRYLRELCV